MTTPTPNMLDFVKAMSDADRLRIIGVLTRRPSKAETISADLGMHPRDLYNHLEFLQYVGIVRKTGDLYDLDLSGLEKLPRGADHESYIPAPELDEKTRKVLASCLNADGSIRQIPSSKNPAKFRVILNYLLSAFTPGVIYTEKEVNMIIRRFHIDTAGLRRDLIDAGLLQRKSDGSQYWRPQ